MRSAIVAGGRFRVFEDGNVNRIKKGIETPANLSTSSRNGKYLVVTYNEDKMQKHVYVHRLIATAFVPNPDNLQQVNHIDGNTMNNAASNLEWVTAKGNVNHAIVTGLACKAASAEQCIVCGIWTLGKDNICPSCSRKIHAEARRIDRRAKQFDRYGVVDLKKCTPKQAEYVLYAMEGLSSAEIARRCGVSKQVVNETLHKVASKLGPGKPMPNISCKDRNLIVSLMLKSEKLRAKTDRAISQYEDAHKKLTEIESKINDISNSYGISVDELLRTDQPVDSERG